MWMIHHVLHILFPSKCIGCGKESVALCTRCITLSRKALTVPHPYIVASFDFKDPLIKKAIHALKYYHRKDLVEPLSVQLAKDSKQLFLPSDTILVPIPMPTTRKLFRGYNQATLIAHILHATLGFSINETLLTRVRTPLRQATLIDKKARTRNQEGSFTASRESRGKTILLIDDVTTTGATLEEARKTLLKQGAYQVFAATLAH